MLKRIAQALVEKLAPGITERRVATVPADWDAGMAGNSFDDWVIRQMLPQAAEATLGSAMCGDLRMQGQLFNSMMDTWDSLSANDRVLGDAVVGAPWELVPFADPHGNVSAKAKERHALVEAALDGMTPDPFSNELDRDGLLKQLARGTLLGHEVSEFLWERRTFDGRPAILPRAMARAGPSYYGYSTTSGRRLRFRPSPGAGWTDFPRHKFLAQICPAHGGHPSQGARLRVLVKYWAGITYGWEWLLVYANKFGSPFRWATYAKNNKEVKGNLLAMLANLGTAGYAVFPEGTRLEMHEASKAAGDLPHTLLMKLANQACDIVIRGEVQTSGTDGKTGLSNGDVQGGVRREALQGVCNTVCTTMQQFARMVCELNYGDCEECPQFTCEIPEPEDAKQNAETDKTLMEMGIPLRMDELRKRHDKGAPVKGETVLYKGALIEWDDEAVIKTAEEAAAEAAEAEQRKAEAKTSKDGKAGRKELKAAKALAERPDVTVEEMLEWVLTTAVISGAKDFQRDAREADGRQPAEGGTDA